MRAHLKGENHGEDNQALQNSWGKAEKKSVLQASKEKNSRVKKGEKKAKNCKP